MEVTFLVHKSYGEINLIDFFYGLFQVIRDSTIKGWNRFHLKKF
jgi:hypothetical protein